MEENIVIRDATQDDLPELAELWKELMDFHASRDSYFQRGNNGHYFFIKHVRERIKQPEWNLVLVAEINGSIVGYCLSRILKYLPVFDRNKHGEIIDLSVTAEFRRFHIGKMLVECSLEWFESEKIERIHVSVSVLNEVSTKFWRKMGFQEFKEILYYNKSI